MAMMRAVALQDVRTLELTEKDIPTPEAGQIIVRPDFCGICGSDLHLYQHLLVPPGSVMGHEFAGIVTAVGAGVETVAEGDRVVCSGGNACGQCKFCRAGQQMQCPEATTVGLGQWDGAYAEYVRLTPRMVSPLQDTVSTRAATLLDPLSTAYHAIMRGGGVTGKTVYVMGLGPIGLALCTMLRFCGARCIVAGDHVAARRELGTRMGADVVIDPRDTSPGSVLDELTDGLGPEMVFEVVGVPGTMHDAIMLCRPQGTMVLVGVCMEPEEITNVFWQLREVSIITTMGYTQAEVEMNRDLIAAGKLDPTPMISEHIDLAQVPEAFERLCAPNTESKILIEFAH